MIETNTNGMEAIRILIETLENYGTVTEGKVYTNEDGEKYRYDTCKSNYKNTPYWMAKVFKNAIEESNATNKFDTNFTHGNFGFRFDRAILKNQKDLGMSFNLLITGL